jgi:hypothetical protein
LETGVTGNRRITCSRAPHGESRRAATAATQQVGVHVGLGVSGPPPRAQGSAQRPAAPGRCRRRRGTGQVRRARQSVRNVGEGACGAGTFHSRLAPMRWEKPVTTSGLLSSGSHCRSPGFCTPDIFCLLLEAVPCGWQNRKLGQRRAINHMDQPEKKHFKVLSQIFARERFLEIGEAPIRS